MMTLDEIHKWLVILKAELPFDTLYTLEHGHKQSCDMNVLFAEIHRWIPEPDPTFGIYHCAQCGATSYRLIKECPECGCKMFWANKGDGYEW